MFILIIIIFILNEKQVISLSHPKLIMLELGLLVLFVVELKIINKIIVKKTTFKKK